MSKGGGSQGTNSTVTQTTTNLPPYAEEYYRGLMQRTAFETAQPYEEYGGQRLAYFSPAEQEAMGRMNQLGVSGDPAAFQQAQNVAAGVAGDQLGGGGINTGRMPINYEPGSPEAIAYEASQRQVGFDPGSLADPEMLARYADPYMQQVVDIQKREANRQADIRKSGIGTQSAASGSLGGYREAIMRSENERNLMQQTGDIQARGSQEAFRNAQQAFNADRSANAQLEQFSQGQFGLNAQNQQFSAQLEAHKYEIYEQAKQKLQEYGLKGRELENAAQIAASQADLAGQQNQLGAADLLGGFGQQQQNMELDRLNAMLQSGQAERGMMQQGLDQGYNDFLRQQAFPREQLSFLNAMLQGQGLAPGSTVATYGPQASTGQQLLGGGIGTLGLIQALQGKGGGG